MNRRALMALVGAGAGLGGAALAWWRFRPGPVLSGAEAAFWAGRFEQPQGGELLMAGLKGQPLLVNFWATWCPPCVEELPMLNAFSREQAGRGWRVVGLAVDRVEPVRSFLQRLPLDFPVGMAGLAGTEISRSLGNTAGGLPFTVVFGSSGQILHRKIGKVSPSDLAQWAQLS